MSEDRVALFQGERDLVDRGLHLVGGQSVLEVDP
jgi:hypothetical protein